MEDWEKDLRHKHKYEDLIINRPEAMTSLRQGTEISVTTIGWIVWIFVCRPLFILFLWVIGFRFFFEHMIDLGGLSGLLDMWLVYTTIIFTIYVVVRGWNVYNKIVYGKKNRRLAMPPASAKDLEGFFRLPDNSVSHLQASSYISVDFESNHRLRVAKGKESGQADDGYFRPT